MKFFNREKEIKYILSVIESEPQLIYFIYGPINNGKTALIFKDGFVISIENVKPEIYYYLVKENILFLDSINEILKPQSRLTYYAINGALKELNI